MCSVEYNSPPPKALYYSQQRYNSPRIERQYSMESAKIGYRPIGGKYEFNNNKQY